MDGEEHKDRDLFSVKKPKRKHEKAKRKVVKDNVDDDWFVDPEKEEIDSANVSVEPLSYEGLMAGIVTLGCISKVTQYYLAVCLPHMIVGRVPITRISSAYTGLLKKVTENKDKSDDAEDQLYSLDSLFKAGQHVITKIESVEKAGKGHRVHLALMPQEVNFGISASKLKKGVVLPCAVASVEDNGYAMETGIPNVRAAFMNRDKVQGAGIVGVGSVVRCVITEVRNSEDGEAVQLKLSAAPKDVEKVTVDVLDTDDFSLLIPGTLVSTTVSSIKKQQLQLTMAERDGVISSLHLSSPLDQLSNYKEGKEVKARVLYITPLSRVVHLTLQQSIFSVESKEELLEGFKIGDKMEGTVLGCHGTGVFFQFGNIRGFCSGNRLRDKEKPRSNLKKDFPVGSTHMLRILDFYYYDQIFNVSLQKSVIQEQTVGYEALTVGQILKVTIKSYEAEKVTVSVATNVVGEIPLLHLTEIRLQNPEKKYAVGSSVKARVLEVVPKRRHLVLTCRRLLTNSEEPVVSEYNKEFETKIVVGYVVNIYPMGLLVAFYNGVKGFVPKSLARTEKVKDLSMYFKVGDVVKGKIILVKPEEQRITLSLILDDDKSNSNVKSSEKQKKKENKELCVRDLVNCVVKKVAEDSIEVRIKPSNLRAKIPIHHLADDVHKCEELKKLIYVGNAIKNVVVFSIGQTITLSMKDSIYNWIHREKAEAQEQLQNSHCYPAVIAEVLPKDVKIAIPVGKFGIETTVYTKGDSSLGLPKENLVIGQSVAVKCEGFTDGELPVLSIQGTYQNLDKKLCLQELYNHLRYENFLKTSHVAKGILNKDFSDIQIGVKLQVEVIAVTSVGLVVKNEQGTIPGIILNEHCEPDTKYVIGSKLQACVLHVHVKEKCLILTARHDLVKELHIREPSNIKVGQNVKCEVLFVGKKFILVKLKSRCKGLMVYIPYKKNLTLRKNVTIIVKYVEGTCVLGVTKAQKAWGPPPVVSAISSIHVNLTQDSKGNNCLGLNRFKWYSEERIAEIAGLTDAKKAEASVEEEDEANNVELTVKSKKRKVTDENEMSLSQVGDRKKAKTKNGAGKQESLGEKAKKRKNTSETEEKAEDKKKAKKKKVIREEEEPVNGLSDSSKKAKKSSCKTDKGCLEDQNDSGVDDTMNSDDDTYKLFGKSKPCLKVGSGFVWDVPENEGGNDIESSSDEEDEDDNSKKKTKKLSKVEREILAKEEEKRLHDLELTRLEKERLPQSALDYEELLQQSPNSSAIWIQFISFHLENAEVEKAKSVAQRALQLINIEEYEERINIWTVMLRLEVLYGTEESVEETFKEALATNDPLKIYMAMAMVYAESNKLKEAEETYFRMSKKFSHVFDVWIKAGIFFFKNGKFEDARKYMERALLSLDKTEHVNLINRFGQLEFQFAEVERARTIFESLLSNYPNRMDIWSVYVDLLAKRGDIEGARQVLERMTGLKLRLQRMRFVFKKFLEFEKQHGTPHSVESVKNRVQDYIAASLQQV